MPSGGTFGTCNASNGTLPHDEMCTMTCGSGGGIMPVSCWNGTVHQPSACCSGAPGEYWSGDSTAAACAACPPGQYDDDGSVLSACVSCVAGQYTAVSGSTSCA
eukprot:COSAG06_NODE_41660_length_389_cov_0.703448_1_plen_103_part_01